MMRSVAACLVLASVACAQGAPIAGDVEVIHEPMESAAVGLHLEQVDDCSRVFTPDAATHDYVAEAVARWSAATGCDIRIGEDGLPVTIADRIYKNGVDASDGLAGGVTRNDSTGVIYEIQISRFALHPYDVTTHEIGHALSGKIWSDPHVHTDTGLMQAKYNEADNEIDDASLALVCSGLPCRQFSPES